MPFFDHPAEQALLGALLALLGKWIYDLTSKRKFMRLEDCDKIRMRCIAERDRSRLICDAELTEKLNKGEFEFDGFHAKVERIECLLGVLVEMQLKICAKVGIDCEQITKAMVKRGVMM